MEIEYSYFDEMHGTINTVRDITATLWQLRSVFEDMVELAESNPVPWRYYYLGRADSILESILMYAEADVPVDTLKGWAPLYERFQDMYQQMLLDGFRYGEYAK